MMEEEKYRRIVESQHFFKGWTDKEFSAWLLKGNVDDLFALLRVLVLEDLQHFALLTIDHIQDSFFNPKTSLN